MEDKREYVRFSSFNLVYYSLIGDTGQIIWEGVGRTLNISKGGALVELDIALEHEAKELVLEIALEEILLKIRGKIVFIRKTDDRKSELGIQFADQEGQDVEVLAAFLQRYDRIVEKSPALLRSKSPSIRNVVLTLSKEHKIINDYVITCRNMLENTDGTHTLNSLLALFRFMEKDTLDHFHFEENILFRAALAGAPDPEILGLVERLRLDHGMLREQIRQLTSAIEVLIQNDQPMDAVPTEQIAHVMRLVKDHARDEMTLLFPAIDADPEKIRALNTLLAEH